MEMSEITQGKILGYKTLGIFGSEKIISVKILEVSITNPIGDGEAFLVFKIDHNDCTWIRHANFKRFSLLSKEEEMIAYKKLKNDASWSNFLKKLFSLLKEYQQNRKIFYVGN